MTKYGKAQFCLGRNNILYIRSINLYICIYYEIHSSCPTCLSTPVCSGFGLMHAAERLHLFHHVVPRAASCRASRVARGHCTEPCVFLGFVLLCSTVGLWQVHRCMVRFVLLPFALLQGEHIRALPALHRLNPKPSLWRLSSVQCHVSKSFKNFSYPILYLTIPD